MTVGSRPGEQPLRIEGELRRIVRLGPANASRLVLIVTVRWLIAGLGQVNALQREWIAISRWRIAGRQRGSETLRLSTS